jgi:hypothetical protein
VRSKAFAVAKAERERSMGESEGVKSRSSALDTGDQSMAIHPEIDPDRSSTRDFETNAAFDGSEGPEDDLPDDPDDESMSIGSYPEVSQVLDVLGRHNVRLVQTIAERLARQDADGEWIPAWDSDDGQFFGILPEIELDDDNPIDLGAKASDFDLPSDWADNLRAKLELCLDALGPTDLETLLRVAARMIQTGGIAPDSPEARRSAGRAGHDDDDDDDDDDEDTLVVTRVLH